MMQPGKDQFERAKELIGARIRELRLAKGLSQEQLTALAGCDRTYVGMLERRQGNPSLSVLAGIAEALDISLVDLLASNPS